MSVGLYHSHVSGAVKLLTSVLSACPSQQEEAGSKPTSEWCRRQPLVRQPWLAHDVIGQLPQVRQVQPGRDRRVFVEVRQNRIERHGL